MALIHDRLYQSKDLAIIDFAAYINGLTGNLFRSYNPKGIKLDIAVKDNGVGFPECLDSQNTESLGLQLVTALIEQLDGTIELDRGEGTSFTLKFKELKYEARM